MTENFPSVGSLPRMPTRAPAGPGVPFGSPEDGKTSRLWAAARCLPDLEQGAGQCRQRTGTEVALWQLSWLSHNANPWPAVPSESTAPGLRADSSVPSASSPCRNTAAGPRHRDIPGELFEPPWSLTLPPEPLSGRSRPRCPLIPMPSRSESRGLWEPGEAECPRSFHHAHSPGQCFSSARASVAVCSPQHLPSLCGEGCLPKDSVGGGRADAGSPGSPRAVSACPPAGWC